MRAKALCSLILAIAMAPPLFASRSSEIRKAVTEFTEAGQFNGVALVGRGDAVIARQATGLANLEWKIPNSVDTKFRIGSVTKAFTALLALQLADRGELDLDANVATYLARFKEKPIGGATVRQLLMHTSGLPDYNNVPPFFRAVQSGTLSEDEILDRIGAYELLFEPGAGFNYSNDGYRLLGAILEQVTGKKFGRALADRLLTPAGMASSGYMSRTAVIPKLADGYRKRLLGLERVPFYEASPASGMYATADDLHRWYRALVKGQLVSKAARELMWSAVPSGNAYGWLVRADPQNPSRRIIVTEGAVFGFFAWTAYIPDGDATIVLLTNTRGPKNHLPALGEAILSILAGRPYARPKQSVAEALLPVVVAGGADAAVARYAVLQRQSDRYDFAEGELNSLGYELLNRGREADAIRIFELNTKTYPSSANAFDSLAEAQMRAGHKQLAIENYERSLALNPKNTNAVEMLKRLRSPE